jgi:hypothetical protein
MAQFSGVTALYQMEDSRPEMNALQVNQVNVNANISDEAVSRLIETAMSKKEENYSGCMKQFILNDSESIWNILPEGEDCVQLINYTYRQPWFLVLSSEQCDGIVAFKGQQERVDQRFDDHLNPKLPHTLPFNEKEGSAMKRIHCGIANNH